MDLEEYKINLENAEPLIHYYPDKWQHYSNDWHKVLKTQTYGGFTIGDKVYRTYYPNDIYDIQYFIELSTAWCSIPAGTVCAAFSGGGFIQIYDIHPLDKP